jgi:hypothetical protein
MSTITDYQSITIEDIIEWCKENNQVEWLKAKAAEKRPFKKYPRVKVDGKWKADKEQEPTIEERSISFIQIKMDFVNEFMPEIAPKKKEDKVSMYDLIKAL